MQMMVSDSFIHIPFYYIISINIPADDRARPDKVGTVVADRQLGNQNENSLSDFKDIFTKDYVYLIQIAGRT